MQVNVNYNGDDIPGSPFEMTSSPDLQNVVDDVMDSRKSSRKASDLMYGRNGTGLQRSMSNDGMNFEQIVIIESWFFMSC